MSLIANLIGTKLKDARDGATSLVASWDPQAVGQAQIDEWRQQSAHLADLAAHAETEAKASEAAFAAAQAQFDKLTSVAEKLQSTNPAVAEEALKQAEHLQGDLTRLKATAADDRQHATEIHDAAVQAEQKVAEGQAKLSQAIHDQERAREDADRAQQHLHDQEVAAGVIHAGGGSDAALDALTANTNRLHQQADSARLRAGVLDQGHATSDALAAALKETDGGTPAPTSFADRLAALKANQ